MASIKLVLALHNHQPVGNFDGVIEAAYQDAYAPILDLLAEYPEVKDKPGSKPLTVTNAAIRFDHVSFAYDPERVILKDVSFEVPAGKMVGA